MAVVNVSDLIPVVDIDVTEERKDSLWKSIQEVGLIVPFVVAKVDDKVYLVDGIQRYHAIKGRIGEVEVSYITGAICDDLIALRQWNKRRPLFRS